MHRDLHRISIILINKLQGKGKHFNQESSTHSVQCLCVVFSVQLAKQWEGRKEGWEIIYGLDSGKCLVFLDIFTFITQAVMIYGPTNSDWIKLKTTFWHFSHQRSSSPPCPWLPAITVSSSISRGPGLEMMTAVRLSLSPGVSGSPVSSRPCSANQRPVLWPLTNQRRALAHVTPSLVTPTCGEQKLSAIDHKQIWPIFIFTKVSKISWVVNKAHSYSP